MERRAEDRDPERAARVSSSEDPFDPSSSDLADEKAEALRFPLALGRTGSLVFPDLVGVLGRDPDLFCLPIADARDGVAKCDEEVAGGATGAADRDLVFGGDVGDLRRVRLVGLPRGSESVTIRDLLWYAWEEELAAVVAVGSPEGRIPKARFAREVRIKSRSRSA